METHSRFGRGRRKRVGKNAAAEGEMQSGFFPAAALGDPNKKTLLWRGIVSEYDFCI